MQKLQDLDLERQETIKGVKEKGQINLIGKILLFLLHTSAFCPHDLQDEGSL